MRAFFAFAVTDGFRHHVRQLQDVLRASGVEGGWGRPENLHVTALFLGEQTEAKLQKLTGILRRALTDFPVFNLTLGDMITFGRPPRVLALEWHGAGRDAYARLVRCLVEEARAADIAIAGGASAPVPVPHTTLARFGNASEARTLGKVGQRAGEGAWEWCAPVTERLAPTMTARFDRVVLLESILGRAGPCYTPRAEFALTSQSGRGQCPP